MPSRDAPEQSYYPSCRVRLIVRLEDYGDPATPEPPAKLQTARTGAADKKAKLLQVVDRDGALLLVGPGDDPRALGSPQQQGASSDAYTHVLDGVIPLSANFLRNGLRTADTATVEVASADLPLDPRTVRSCAVQLYMGTVSPEDYSRGALGEMRDGSATQSGVRVPYNVLPDSFSDPYHRPRSNLRFEGWVDEWQVAFPDSDASSVTLQCTDNTRLLIDAPAGPKLFVDPNKPLDQAIAGYLANYPQFRGLSVQYRPPVQPGQIPTLKDSLSKTKYQPKLGPPPSGGGAGASLKVWDYLTDVAASVAHTVRLEGTRVIVQRARTLYDSSLQARGDDTFTGRRLPSGLELPRRLYAYGKNVQDLKVSRKYATVAGVNIEVRSYDSSRKKTLVVRFPQKEDRVKQIHPGTASADQKWKVITVAGVVDPKVLRAIGQGIYEQVNRNELVSRLVTQNLGSYGGGNADPDALDLLAGDSVDVRILRDEDASRGEGVGNTVQSAFSTSLNHAVEFLQHLGYSERFATAYQKALNNVGFPATFKVKTFGCQWQGQDSGITLDLELMNYVEIRADKLLPAGEEVTPAQASAGEPVDVKVEPQ